MTAAAAQWFADVGFTPAPAESDEVSCSEQLTVTLQLVDVEAAPESKLAFEPAIATPRCDSCGRLIDPFEGGRCDRCRMVARGDNVLVAHDDRGWHHPTDPDRRIRCACGGEGCDPVNPALLAEPGELKGGTAWRT